MPKKKITLADFDKDPVLKAHSMRSKAVARALDQGVPLPFAINRQGRVKLGSLLAEIGRQAELSDEEFAGFARVRGK